MKWRQDQIRENKQRQKEKQKRKREQMIDQELEVGPSLKQDRDRRIGRPAREDLQCHHTKRRVTGNRRNHIHISAAGPARW
jgi:hypothetical protein